MVKDQIVTQAVKSAAHRLLAVQHARQDLAAKLQSLEEVIPRLSRDRVFDLAMNHHTPAEWLRMPPLAIERHLACELGLRPVRKTQHSAKPRKRVRGRGQVA